MLADPIASPTRQELNLLTIFQQLGFKSYDDYFLNRQSQTIKTATKIKKMAVIRNELPLKLPLKTENRNSSSDEGRVFTGK